MGEFTAGEATVHTAIGRYHLPPDHARVEVDDPPAYVPRAHDRELRADIEQAAAGKLRALVVVRGTSSTGKTRSLWEAVHALCPGWLVARPRGAAAVRGLPGSGLFDRPVVVWLNELQGFLGPNGQGLSIDVLRDLFAAAGDTPVVLVGTLWPDKLHTLTDPRDDTRSDTRELLAAATRWVRWHDVAPTLTTRDERMAAEKLAKTDPRLAAAVADPDRFGFAQTLAGAHELLEHYRTAPTPARLLLEAAAVAGYAITGLPTKPLLRTLTLALWREEHDHTALPTGWFETALSYAIQSLRSDDGVRALIPLTDSDLADQPEPSGYGMADYLQQHLIRDRMDGLVTDQMWEALRANAQSRDELVMYARVAGAFSKNYHQAEAFYRAAGAGVLREYAWWLSRRPGREADAEAAYREAVDGGDPDALRKLADWLGDLPGREADAKAARREHSENETRSFSEMLDELLRLETGRRDRGTNAGA